MMESSTDVLVVVIKRGRSGACRWVPCQRGWRSGSDRLMLTELERRRKGEVLAERTLAARVLRVRGRESGLGSRAVVELGRMGWVGSLVARKKKEGSDF